MLLIKASNLRRGSSAARPDGRPFRSDDEGASWTELTVGSDGGW
ncbi:hypothetical protein U2F26_34095 [Micromonospora sp. 4G57]|uniref:Exo-alpha-sialidase n=1 Tax=Micromonospora sicca TaxID=2202420 RepID=A0ABU5JP42_9ACTN|nr:MULTISPECIES: hypothetical protein [unclassified Micromonospora]MDZ5447681.1 hypothetical protein [Micromonospora sp. 4G57]MDZ5494400.1 hypothetical protein [Micromonospora sp. 4G53]